MIPEHISVLADKYLQGIATHEEIQALHDWYDAINPSDTEVVITQAPITSGEFGIQTLTEIMELIRAERTAEKKYFKFPFWLRMTAAAAIILIAGSAGYFWYSSQNASQYTSTQNIQSIASDLKPGGNIAVLTLSDGSTIVLDSAAMGTISQQGGTKVIKLADGQLAYNGQAANDGKLLYNTLTTPKGGQYRISLPDGSEVWLNAASSLKYPTAFAADQRIVELQGEAYFEVAANVNQPFIVQTKQHKVAVLGTHFNVNAYDEEPAVRTTLLEGSVAVSNATGQVRLVPGQQASIHPVTNGISIANADVEQAIAWKNGMFSFYNADLKTIMRQFARWYDVEVVYEGVPSNELYVGEVPRNSKASEVLKILELSKVHYRMEGKTIILTP